MAVLSAVVVCVFFSAISMNGLVLGNDPSVHLEKTLIFLRTGEIPLGNLGWTPPLYSILVAVFIAFTNAGSLAQLILMIKMAAVLINWLLFLSVYLLGSKFFGRRVGAVAAVLLFMCFPMYEVNAFGGYTTVLALAFVCLVFLYTPLAAENFGYLLVNFLAAFALVLSHQLATFLAVFMMPPILLFMLIKSKGAYLKVVLALILGGGIAFFLYYFQAMVGYLHLIIEYIFFAIKEYSYQIPSASLNAFMINFGFILFLALGGIIISYYLLKTQRKLIFFITLMVSFFVPLFFAESYLFGLYMPFQWFIYYLVPPITVLGAAASIFAFDMVKNFYSEKTGRKKKIWLQAVVAVLVILVSMMVLFRFETVYDKTMEAGVYYSTSDLKALEAGEWLRDNCPENTTVVVTEIPGYWFRLFSGKSVIAATNPIIHRNEISESVLDLSYEIEQPLTLLRAYEAKGATSYESYVSIDNVWKRVTFSSGDGDFVLYRDGGKERKMTLTSFKREIVFEHHSLSSKRLLVRYVNDDLTIDQTITVNDDSYTTDVSWSLVPLRREISAVSLYVTVMFDLNFRFEKAYVPGLLNWENPWSRPSDSKGSDWVVTDFSSSTLTDSHLGFYDENEDVVFALRFKELPDWGNVGALASMQIDAVRLRYNFDLGVSPARSFAYQTMTFSKSRYPAMLTQPINVRNLFDLKPAVPFALVSRDYRDYIQANNIEFIVYDKNKLDMKITSCRLLQLVYSNDRYVIFRIKSSA